MSWPRPHPSGERPASGDLGAFVPPLGHSLLRALRRWLAANAVPLGIFAANRFGLYLLAYLSLVLLPMPTADGLWRHFPENLFLDGWARWDAAWYHVIADEGYTNLPRNPEGQRDTAFFPLYPTLIRTLTWVVHDDFLAGLIVSNGAFLLALLVFYHLVREHYGPGVAQRALVLFSVYPFAFYFSAMYTESLFLLAVVAAFYFGERRRWVLAGLCAAAASATRTVGVLVVGGLIVLYLEQIGFQWRKIRPNIAWTLLGLAGIGGYMLFLALEFGDPLQFVKSYNVTGWGAGVGWDRAVDTLRAALAPNALATGRYEAMSVINLLALAGALGLSALAWRKPRIAYSLWALGTVLASSKQWIGAGRYVAVIFPMFVVLALYLRQGRAYQLALYFSTLLLALFTIMYAHFYWVS